MGENALRVLRARYLRRDVAGDVVETPEQLFVRVAHAVPKPSCSMEPPPLPGFGKNAFVA